MIQFELVRVTRELARCEDLACVTQTLGKAARQLTGADGVTLVLRDGTECVYADEDSIAPLWKGRRFPMDACVSGWSMLNRQAVAIADIYADARVPYEAYRPSFVKSLAMAPIRIEDPIGAIGAYWEERHEPTADELDTLQALADSAVVVGNLQRVASLRDSDRRKTEFLAALTEELSESLAQQHDPRLARIVESLSEALLLAEGRMVIRRERLDLRTVAQECVESFGERYRDARIRLVLDMVETPVWISGERSRLAEALGNVLDNARKFTPEEGKVEVQVWDDRDSRHGIVLVRDSGQGIERHVLPGVFDMFGRIDARAPGTSRGVGFGLALAKALLELHGGSIEAASDGAGRGTEFTLRLPLHDAPAAGASRTA